MILLSHDVGSLSQARRVAAAAAAEEGGPGVDSAVYPSYPIMPDAYYAAAYWSTGVYCTSLLALYLASALYHGAFIIDPALAMRLQLVRAASYPQHQHQHKR